MKIKAALGVFVAILLTPACAVKRASAPGSFGSSDGEWSDVTAWLQQQGATVSGKPAENKTHHGGAWVRGITAKEAIDKFEVLLRVPKRLWMSHDNFEIPHLAELRCDGDEGDLHFQAAVAVALEMNKKQNSRWHAYLKGLPTLEEYQSFYIIMASPELLRQFRGLPLVSEVKQEQERIEQKKLCFNDWKQQFGHEGLSWQDVKHGIAIWRTRNYQFMSDEGHANMALIPGDFCNTDADSQVNTIWELSKSSNEWYFQMYASKAIAAGGELYESYCPQCTNDDFLKGWGVFLDQSNKVREFDAAGLDAGDSSALKAVVQATLTAPDAGIAAPLCKRALLDEPQGPIKCALARLAWEQYGKSWGLKSQSPHYSLLQEGLERSNVPSSTAHLLMNSRGMVVPQILS